MTNPNTGGKLNLSWIARTESNISFYGVDRGTVSNFETVAPPGLNVGSIAHPGTTFSDTGLTDGVTYYYHIHTFGSAYYYSPSNSGPSNEAFGVPTSPPPPAVPNGLMVRNPGGPGGILDLAWTPNTESDLKDYGIYRATWAAPAPIRILAPGTTHRDAGLTATVTYYYRLSARNLTLGESALSSTVWELPADLPPAIPRGFQVVDFDPVTAMALKLLWQSNTESDLWGYTIYRTTRTTGAIFPPVPPETSLANVFPPGTNYLDSGLTPNKPYRYAIQAFDAPAFQPSGPTWDVFAVPGFPSAPANLGVTDAGTSGRLNLSWTGSPELDVAQYRVWRGAASGPLSNKTVANIVLAPGTTFQDRNLVNGTPQFYQVTARDSSLNESLAATAEASAIPTFANTELEKFSVSVDIPGVGTTQLDVPKNDIRIVTETRPDVPLGMVSSEANQTIVAAVANTQGGEFTFRVFTLAGELVKEIIETRNPLTSFSFVPQDLGSGIYIIEVEGPGIKKVSKKVAIGR